MGDARIQHVPGRERGERDRRQGGGPAGQCLHVPPQEDQRQGAEKRRGQAPGGHGKAEHAYRRGAEPRLERRTVVEVAEAANDERHAGPPNRLGAGLGDAVAVVRVGQLVLVHRQRVVAEVEEAEQDADEQERDQHDAVAREGQSGLLRAGWHGWNHNAGTRGARAIRGTSSRGC